MRRKSLKRLVGLGRFELPTHGLGNRFRPVPPVRNIVFSIGCPASHTGNYALFGQEYAPQNAPLTSAGFYDHASLYHGSSAPQLKTVIDGGDQ